MHVLAYAFDPLDERIERAPARLPRDAPSARLRHRRAPPRPRREHHRRARRPARRRRRDGPSARRPRARRSRLRRRRSPRRSTNYLGTGKPGYVEKERFRIGEAVSLIRAAGGVTSIAHPTLYPDHETPRPAASSTTASTPSRCCTRRRRRTTASATPTWPASAASSPPAAPTTTAR